MVHIDITNANNNSNKVINNHRSKIHSMAVSVKLGLLNSFIAVACLVAGSEEQIESTSSTNHNVTASMSAGDFNHTATETQPSFVHAYANCTDPYASPVLTTDGDGDTLLTFSAAPDHGATHAALPACVVHLTSQRSHVISAVLLEHSPCHGGVFVTLLEATRRRQWDVCSAWHTPGPNFMTLSNVVEVRILLADASNACDLNISIRAVRKLRKGELETRYLSSSEGSILCVARVFGREVHKHVCVYVSVRQCITVSVSAGW